MPTPVATPDYKKFLLIESNQIPLTEIPMGDLKANIMDPTTGKPYKGIVLGGVFADLNATPNNNKRLYDIPRYLELLNLLKKQILSKKGVYGELEHPKSYSVSWLNVSHKIIDIWYDETTKLVHGKVILLDTPNGKIAQEIVKSGGQLAISGRAAGEENKNADGTFTAITKLLTTFDLVYHPGFSIAVLEFKSLNESQQELQHFAEQKKGFSVKVYEEDFKKIDSFYEEYITLNENNNCFFEWYNNNLVSLSESSEQTESEKNSNEKDQKILEKNQSNDQNKLQKNLETASDDNLSEAKKQRLFFQNANIAQKKLRNSHSELGNSFYDNTAGFINSNSSQLSESKKKKF